MRSLGGGLCINPCAHWGALYQSMHSLGGSVSIHALIGGLCINPCTHWGALYLCISPCTHWGGGSVSIHALIGRGGGSIHALNSGHDLGAHASAPIEIVLGAWSSHKNGRGLKVGRGNALKMNGNSFARLGGHLGS